MKIKRTPIFAATLLSQAAGAANLQTHLEYIIAPGDSLYSIATRYLNNQNDYLALQKSLHEKSPRALQPGAHIFIPRTLLKTVPVDAHIVSYGGDVRIDHNTVTNKTLLREGSEIMTGSNAYATFVLSNGSKITIPSQTTITLSRLRRAVIDDSLEYEVSLANGHLATKATHLDQTNSQFRVRTPFAVSAVRGTEFRIAFDQASGQPSFTEVLGGAVAVGAEHNDTTQLIPLGNGISIAEKGDSLVEKLLKSPEIQKPNHIQFENVLNFKIKPVTEAASYHLDIARDAEFGELIDSQNSSSPELHLNSIPDGEWYVRAAAVSKQGFTGLADQHKFKRRLNTIKPHVDNHGSLYDFSWQSEGRGAKQFHFELKTTHNDLVPIVDEPSLAQNNLKVAQIAPGDYLWHVGSTVFDDDEVKTNWSPYQSLHVPESHQ